MTDNSILVGYCPKNKICIYVDPRTSDKLKIIDGPVSYEMNRTEFGELIEFTENCVNQSKIETQKTNIIKSIFSISYKNDKNRSAFFLENGNIKLKWLNYVKIFIPKNFIAFFETIKIASLKAAVLDDKINKKRAEKEIYSAADTSFLAKAGYSLFLMTSLITTAIIFASIYNPVLLPFAGAAIGFAGLVYVLVPKHGKKVMKENFKRYLDEEFSKDLNNFHMSRKSVEFFTIIFLVIFFMAVVFSKAIPFIINFWKSMYA